MTVKNKETKTRLLSKKYFWALPTKQRERVRRLSSQITEHGVNDTRYGKSQRAILHPSIAKSMELDERGVRFAGFASCCTFKDVSLIDSQMAGDPAAVVLHADHRRAGNG